jgi:twitching motility two-component system response regulator PilG
MSHAHPLQHAAAAARAGNSALAKIHLQKAAEADPDDPAVWLWMSWLSDSPMSMVQCLEMLLDNEQFRPVAEAGMYFAQTLNQFRHGHDVRMDATTNDAVHPQAAPVQPAADPPQTVAPPVATPITPDEVIGTTHAPPTPSDDTFRQDDEPESTDAPVAVDVPAQQVNEVQNAIVEPAQIVDRVPEIVFEKSFDHASEPHALNAQPEVLDTFDTAHTLDGVPNSNHAHQAWCSEWAPVLTSEETESSIEATAERSEDVEPLDEPDQPEPVVIPTAMFRPACTDWFSPGGNSQVPGETHEVQPAAPAMSQWSRAASPRPLDFEVAPDRPTDSDPGSAHSHQTVPATSISAPAVPQPSNESPPPVWRRPASVRPPGRASTYEVPTMRDEVSSRDASPVLHENADSFVESPPVSGDATPATTTILVVDDSPTVRKLVAMTLEKRGYRVVTAFDGVAAMKEIAAQNPALILMDVNMPRLDGYQLCKLVKKHDSTRHIPVIMLSGTDGVFDRLRGRLVGCAGYISKPFVPEALVEMVDQYLSQAAHN